MRTERQPKAVRSSDVLGHWFPDIKPPHAIRELSSRKGNNCAGTANLINMKYEVLVIAWVFDLRSLSGVSPLVLPNIEAANLKRLTIGCSAEELPVRCSAHGVQSGNDQKLSDRRSVAEPVRSAVLGVAVTFIGDL